MSVTNVSEVLRPVVVVSTLARLQQLDTVPYGEGQLCYVSQTKAYYSFQVVNLPSIDGVSVFAGARSGAWVRQFVGNSTGGSGSTLANVTSANSPYTLLSTDPLVYFLGDSVQVRVAGRNRERAAVTVHVMAPPDHPMEPDASLCTDARDTEVVYHAASVALTGGGWACAECGVSSAEEPLRLHG